MDEEDESDQTEHAGSPDKAQVGGHVYVCMCACVTVCVCDSPDKAQVGWWVCACVCVPACVRASQCVSVAV